MATATNTFNNSFKPLSSTLSSVESATTTATTASTTNGKMLNLNTNLNLTSIILIAKFDYEAKEQHELDLKKYERLILIDNTKNWWLVKRCDNDQTGYIPSNYVKKEKKSIFDKIMPRKLTKTDHLIKSPKQPTQTTTIVNNHLCSSFASVKHKYIASKVDELTLNVGTRVKVLEKFVDGWWKVVTTTTTNDKELMGLYPSNYLQEESPASWNTSESPKISFDTSAVHNTSSNDTTTNNNGNNTTKCESISSNEKDLEYVRVVYAHRARKSCEYSNPIIVNEITVDVGEVLKLIEEDSEYLDYDKSWLKVFNSQGITGLIPSNCVQPILDNQMTHFVFIRRPTSQGIFGNNPWYFGNITRFETIILFNKFASNGDFIVRDSDNGNFSISLKSESLNNKHFKVFFKDNKFTIGKKIFYSIDELLDHYHKNPIFDQNGEKLFLVKPFNPPAMQLHHPHCFDI